MCASGRWLGCVFVNFGLLVDVWDLAPCVGVVVNGLRSWG